VRHGKDGPWRRAGRVGATRLFIVGERRITLRRSALCLGAAAMNKPVPVNPPELRSTFVASSSMPWRRTEFDGIEMKILYQDDEGRSTILFKMAPGAIVPLHEHTALEQTYMLEGSLEDAEGSCGPGDFVWRPGGNIHVAHAPKGATFISVFNRPNRFFDGTKFFTAAKK
jgi:anti-sigma factor ChrR (cupin superfamily)